VRPVVFNVTISAPWRKGIILEIGVSLDQNGADDAILSGPILKTNSVGDDGNAQYNEQFELFAFRTGEQHLRFTMTDEEKRCIHHVVRLHVGHIV
jgi:hypothetical protein